MGKELRAPMISECTTLYAPPHVHPPRSCLKPVLLGFYGGSITQAWLIKSLVIGNGLNLQPYHHPRGPGGGTERTGSPGNQRPPFGASQKAPH